MAVADVNARHLARSMLVAMRTYLPAAPHTPHGICVQTRTSLKDVEAERDRLAARLKVREGHGLSGKTVMSAVPHYALSSWNSQRSVLVNACTRYHACCAPLHRRWRVSCLTRRTGRRRRLQRPRLM